MGARSLMVGLQLGALIYGVGVLPAKEPPVASAPVDAQADTGPRPIRQSLPEYPLEMRYSGNRGRVVVEFLVGADGVPQEPVIVSSNHPAFERAAADAVLAWRFEPARKAGEAVVTRVRQELVFNLKAPWTGMDPFSAPPRAPDAAPEAYRYDTPPEVDLMVAPVYPRELALAGIKGSAHVAFVLNTAGVPVELEVLESSEPAFGAALAAAVESWRFKPARKNGGPCAALLSYRMEFGAAARDRNFEEGNARVLARLKKDGGAGLPNLSELDTLPATVFRAMPTYPFHLRKAGVTGVVRVRFIIDRDGVPRFPAAEGAEHEGLAWAAVTAVQRQRYARPLKKGKPVDVWATLPIAFNLADSPGK